MTNLIFEYHPAAIREAHHAYHWYDQQSAEAADRFWHELRNVRANITAAPNQWPIYHHGTRLCLLKRFPYGVAYSVEGSKIIGWAVCHLKQKPGYWLGRKNQ